MNLIELRNLINERIDEGLGDFEVVTGTANFLVPFNRAIGTTKVIKIPHPSANVQAYRVPINEKDESESERVTAIVF